MKHCFGGDWTQEKLEKVGKYLKAYSTIMNKQPFKYAYIDAFAGTGIIDSSRQNLSNNEDQLVLFDGQDVEELKSYSEGSVRIALQIKPQFDKYIFIDKSVKHCQELENLKEEFPDKKQKIQIVNDDANEFIMDLCQNKSWKARRAVMFLDPYGMQVEWETIKAIAATKAIDLWYLFPLGVGVNRLLQEDAAKIPDSWKLKLDNVFGTNAWLNAFYKKHADNTLFGIEERVLKETDFQHISSFIIEQLKTIFAGVAENPLLLCNSRNNPLYLLCFAAGNPKGSTFAKKIAQDILGK